MRATRSFAVLAAAMGLAALNPTAVDAAACGDSPRIVVTPSHDVSGLEDTDAIQQALGACISAGRGCTVQLTAGTFYVKEIAAFGFQGRLRGRGSDRTVLEVVPPLTQPTVLAFIGGQAVVSDLTLRAPDADPAAVSGGLQGIVFVGDGTPGRYAVERVRMQSGTLGVPVYVPDQPTIHIGVWYAGDPSADEVRVQSSSFENIPFLFGSDGITGARVTFSHNRVSRYYFGVQIFNLHGCRLTVAHNVAREAQVAGVVGYFLVAENPGPSSVSKQSLVSVHHNDVEAAGLAGFLFSDTPDPAAEKTLRVAVHRNRIAATEVLFGGIASRWVDGLRVIRNVVTGTGSNAIGLGWGGFAPAPGETDGYGQIVNNDVKDFLVTLPTIFGYGVGPIWLGPQSHHTRVITKEPGLVYDEGVDNRVIGR